KHGHNSLQINNESLMVYQFYKPLKLKEKSKISKVKKEKDAQFLINTTTCAAKPCSWPIGPSFSMVLALMLICSGEIFKSLARFLRMAGIYGVSLGFSAMIVASRLPML